MARYTKKDLMPARSTIVITQKELTNLLNKVRLDAKLFSYISLYDMAKEFIQTHIKTDTKVKYIE